MPPLQLRQGHWPAARADIRAIVNSPDGMARATLRDLFENKLSVDDVQALAPDILAAVKVRCPADTMFGNEIRMGGFKALAEYHFKEGIEDHRTVIRSQYHEIHHQTSHRPAAAAGTAAHAEDQPPCTFIAGGTENGGRSVPTWNYFGFNLPKPPADPKAKVIPIAKLTWPDGMESWFAVDFDAKKACWKRGPAPFGERSDKLVLPDWLKDRVGKRNPATLVEHDVLLLRQTFDLPPLKPGHRYRIRVGGNAHNNMGEGYAIYVNGKLLAESKGGIVAWRREGHRPRGGHVPGNFRNEFSGGRVSVAVSNFPMDNRPIESLIPPGDTLSVWIEEMKLPPLDLSGQ